MRLVVGELTLELRHARGETGDHLYAWLPERKAIAVGDFVTWVFPNAGNPQKVQRYPLDWAHALREMSALGAELLLPAHGLPIAGAARIARVLDDVASALEHVVNETLDAIVHAVRVPLTCSSGRTCGRSTTSRSSWSGTSGASTAAGTTAIPRI